MNAHNRGKEGYLYSKNEANYPRIETDQLFVDYNNSYLYRGFMDKTIRSIESAQLLRADLWKRFVQQFREDADYDGGWRGEYWGKMMRGACFTYSYTKNEELYAILTTTVCEMIDSADGDGRISSYGKDHEFDGWDIWSRKYVLLGMQYYLEICRDEDLKVKIVQSMCHQVDYIISKIGSKDDGKREITSATRHWRGINSSSILEPIVRLYTITKKIEYFDFASYIVNHGGADIANIFELAYDDKLYPYQYPVTKAYEMTSCFEGLLEFYRITGEERYKTAIINFANKVLESDFTIIGCCGCTHELFDHSSVRQANTTNGEIMQETCVTVTLMKFFYQLTLLTGDAKYSDAFEISLYNAFLGSVNTENIIPRDFISEISRNHSGDIKESDLHVEPLPFDSYSPLTAGKRGEGIGGLKIMSDNHFYGCCVCIGSAGSGLVPKMNLLTSKDGFAVNLYIDGQIKAATPLGKEITVITETAYPKDGNVKIILELTGSEEFEILLRNPSWSLNTSITVNGRKEIANSGYIAIKREWKNGDVIELEFDMRTKAIYPIPYGHQVLMNKVVWGHNYVVPSYDEEDPIAKNHIALQRGPVILAQENRLGYSVDEPVSIKVDKGYVDVIIPKNDTAPYEHIVEVKVPLCDGTYMTVTDYSSAGKLWNDESKMAAWILTK